MKNKVSETANKRKCKCGRCGEEIKKGAGYFQYGMTSHKTFYICEKCFRNK